MYASDDDDLYLAELFSDGDGSDDELSVSGSSLSSCLFSLSSSFLSFLSLSSFFLSFPSSDESLSLPPLKKKDLEHNLCIKFRMIRTNFRLD